MMPTKQNRLTELDALRGIAALSVVLFHYTTWYNNKFILNVKPCFLFGWGYCGVHLFFMISGFVIFMTLTNIKRPQDFIISRFARLYPAFWAVLVLNLILNHDISLKSFLFNLTMVPSWFDIKDIDPVFWTLSAELSFYIIMFTLLVIRKLEYIEELGLLWLSLMVLNARLGGFVNFQLPWFFEKSFLLAYGNLFFAGILFYKIKFEGNTLQRNIALLLCWLTQFIIAREFFPSPVMVAGFFAVFYLFCFDKLKFLNQKWLLFLGTISYSLYLTHENLGVKILLHFDSIRLNYFLNLSIAIGISITVAAFNTYVIEKPSLKFIKNLNK